MQETLSRTTLGQSVEGDIVNLERALKIEMNWGASAFRPYNV